MDSLLFLHFAIKLKDAGILKEHSNQCAFIKILKEKGRLIEVVYLDSSEIYRFHDRSSVVFCIGAITVIGHFKHLPPNLTDSIHIINLKPKSERT